MTGSSGILVICFNGHIVHNNVTSFITNTPCMTGVVVCRAQVIVRSLCSWSLGKLANNQLDDIYFLT